MVLYHKTETQVLAWDDIQFGYYVNQAQRFGRWLWNFFPPEVGGKTAKDAEKNAAQLRNATPELLVPSEEKMDDTRAECKAHGLIGPQ